MEPFSIQCTTCRRSLRVVSAEAIGQILSCPKCGSMVLIEPPSAPSAETSDPAPQTQPASPPAPVLPAPPPPTVATAPVPPSIPAAASPPAPVDEIPVALPVVEEPFAAARWPWWFWPGVAATATLSLAIIAVRLEFFSGVNDVPALATAAAMEATRDRADNAPSFEPAPVTEPTTAGDSGPPAVVEPPASDQPPVEPTPTKESQTVAPVAAEPPAAESPVAAEAPPEPVAPATEGQPAAEVAALAAGPADARAPAHTTMLRVPSRAVDVDSRLGDSIPAIDALDVPLWAMLELISQMSTIPITLDVDSLAARGQSAAMPVTARLGSGPAADALEAVLEPHALVYQVRDGQLIVGHLAPEEMRRVRYTVSDLVGIDGQALNELGMLVRRMVMPGSWKEAGGRASLAAESGTLIIDQSDAAHLEILVLCEKLRTARGAPTKSRYEPSTFRLASRHAKAEKMLTRRVTANFATPGPLQAVVSWLRQATGATIVIDYAALAREGTSQESHAMVVANNKPLEQLLDDLLSPIDLAWRAVDDRTIEITTPAAAGRGMNVEFYPVRDLPADASSGGDLMDRIRRQVEPQSWGDEPNAAAMQFDAPSHTLIVRAPYRLQEQVEQSLAAFRTAAADRR